MSTFKEIALCGLKDLENIENGIKTASLLDGIMKNILEWINTCHDDLLDHDDSKVISNFPNALLLEAVCEKIKPKITDPIPKEKKESEDPEDIWNILEKIKEENNSESLDSLTTESEYVPPINKDRICKGCNTSGKLVEDQHTGVIVCLKCGMMNEELLDHGPEWRKYNSDDNRSEGIGRCGCPHNFFFPKSCQGTIMTGTSNSRLRRKQKWNSTIYKERSLKGVFEFISNVCSKNNIPKIIVDSAITLYKMISDSKHKTGSNTGKQIIIRGDNRTSIIASCVFKSCEINKNPRSIKEIATYFELDEKKITKGNKQFDRIMKNVEDNEIILEQMASNTTAEDYIRRHSFRLKINKNDMDMAIKISNNCCKMKLVSDHNPRSIAAGSIFTMANYLDLNIERKQIAKLFGTSDVTIGKIYNKLIPYIDALTNDEATDYLIKRFKINGDKKIEI